MKPGRSPVRLLQSLLGVAIAVCLPAMAPAETVTLKAPSGLSLTGTFIAYDGEFYRIATDSGEVSIVASGLSCEGRACPGDITERLGFEAGDPSVRRLALSLLRHFAAAEGWSVVETHDLGGPVEIAMGEAEAKPRLVVVFGASPGAWKVFRDPQELPQAGWRDTPLAFDALVPAVSVENAVTGLTLLGVRAALAGEFPDWVGLGGSEAPVSVHWSDVLDGALTERYALSPGTGATRHEDIADVADAVARTPGGLGLLPLSDIGSAVPLVLTGSCGRGAVGVAPAIRTGDYPLSEAVILRRPAGRPAPVARAFLDWLETPAAGAAVRRAGFVDLAVGVAPPGRDGRQVAGPPSLASSRAGGRAAMEADLGAAQRLDVAVRFEDGSSLPDRAARIQIARLARAISSGQFDGRRLLFAGFSDATGVAATNLVLSRRRAEAVHDAVLAELRPGAEGVTIEARGFGETAPVACNGVEWGERLNRRVEVWLAPEGR